MKKCLNLAQILTWLKVEWLTALILVLAIGLRFFQLGQVPHGLTWDEAAVGYNGFAVITTRRDEWLHKLPISFRSFGDYKAPLAIYLNGIFTTILGLGLSSWAIRLPFAISGVIAVLGLIILTKELLSFLGLKETGVKNLLGNLAGLWLAISPWHIHFTRTGFESGLAVTILIWSAWLTLKSLKSFTWQLWSLTAFGWILSLYTYHSAKIVVPFLLLGLIIWQGQKIWQLRKTLIFPISFGLILLIPLVRDALVGDGLTRAGTLLFSRATSVQNFFELLWQNLLAQDSLSFWVKGGTTTLRHSDGQTGVIYWPDLVAIIFAIGIFCYHRLKKFSWIWLDKWTIFGTSWTIIGLLPAILASETPHPNRAILAIVGVSCLVLIGWLRVYKWLTSKIGNVSFWLIGGCYLISLVFYQYNYYTLFKSQSATAFFDGYLEAAQIAVRFEKNPPAGQEVDKILFTDYYGQPYIFVLLIRKTNPIWYQGGALIKYEFTSKINTGDLDRPKTLVIASPVDNILDAKKPDQLIYGSDGQIKFKIFYPKKI